MRHSAVFVFDTSYPTIDIALPIDDSIPHIFISTRHIESPPGHTSLHLQEATSLPSFFRNLAYLRMQFKRERSIKCIVIAAPGTRQLPLFVQSLYALYLTRNVVFFDGLHLRPVNSSIRTIVKAAVTGVGRSLVGSSKRRVNAALFQWRLRSLANLNTPESNFFGLYTASRRFSLPFDRISFEPDGSSIYGQNSRGWYLPAFSGRRQRYTVISTRHSIGEAVLHVAFRLNTEVSVVLRQGCALDYPYFLGRDHMVESIAVSTRRAVHSIDRGICLLAYTSGYYHWLLEGLPRILDLIDDGLDLNRYTLILPPLTPFQTQSLELLGVVPDRQVLSLAVGDWCYVKDCVFPTAYFPFGAKELEDPSGQPDRSLLLRLRRRILERLPTDTTSSTQAPRKLYISRSRAAKRKLSADAEAEVVAILVSAGFSVVHLEDLAWTDQIRLLANAEYVVGFHGAGLSNILFASNLKGLLEFHNPFEVRPYFALIARELQIEYRYLIGSLEAASPSFDNVTLDLDMLKRHLSGMLTQDAVASLSIESLNIRGGVERAVEIIPSI